jgi:hypothetical protein
MDTIKKLLLIFIINTLLLLVSWAGLSLVLLGVRMATSPESGLSKIISIHSYVVVMFFYGLYLIYDVCEYLSTASRGQM